MWLKISEFPDYEVNEISQIRNSKTKRVIKASKNQKGYLQISIKGKCRKPHRLSAIEFIPNPDNLETVNHKNGIKDDNRVVNLEWMSISDNVKHSYEVLNIIRKPYSLNRKENHLIGRNGFNSNAGKSIVAIFEDGSKKEYGSSYDAARELFKKPSLGKMIRKYMNLNKKYNGIRFEKRS